MAMGDANATSLDTGPRGNSRVDATARRVLGASRPMHIATFFAVLAVLAIGSLGCGGGGPAVPLTQPTSLCVAGREGVACREAQEVERALASRDLEILGAGSTPHGIQGARVLTLAAQGEHGRVVFRAKWRAHASADDLNRPRKEVLAHAVQKLFLDPDEWVIPPAAGHCFPLEAYRKAIDPLAKPTYPPATCVLGVLTYWLEGSQSLDDAEDEDWIPTEKLQDTPRAPDPGLYDSIADVNLACYLISHGDSHPQQFVVTREAATSRVYIVDNSISFTAYRNPSLPKENVWANFLVHAIRKKSIDRLRKITHQRMEDLAAVEQYVIEDGQLVATTPSKPGRRTESAFRWVNGQLQMGLTHPEITVVEQRMQELFDAVDEGRVRLYE
jgi:hypothetical protein